jgi:glycosyltransferase involved in cell wall biosynthesis
MEIKKIRVGFLSPGWPLKYFPNGIVAYIQNMIQGQEDKMTSFVLTDNFINDNNSDNLIKLSTTKSLIEKTIDKILYRIKFQHIYELRHKRYLKFYVKNILQAIKKIDVPLNVIEVEETNGIAFFLTKKTKVPIVTRLHGPWFIHGPIMQMDQLPYYELRVFYEGEAIKASQGVTAPSLDVLEKVRNFYGIPLPDAKVIPNPIVEVPKHNQWKYNPDSIPYVLVVGRFDLHKGGDLAIKSFRLIAQKQHNIELLFVGPDNGIPLDGKNLHINEYINLLIPEDDIKQRIKFLGHCDHVKIAQLRKGALVTLMCSRYETFSISLAEALATGNPVVATSVGAIKELIIDNFNGVLAEPESPEDIAEKVLSLIHDPKRMEYLSKNAIEDSKARFSPEVVAFQTIEFYKSLISNK